MVKKAFPLLLAAMLLAATPTLAYAAEPPWDHRIHRLCHQLF